MQQWKKREKEFLRLLSGRKSMHFFSDKILRKNVRERAMPKRSPPPPFSSYTPLTCALWFFGGKCREFNLQGTSPHFKEDR
jgi:hypothetical protein